MEFLLHSALLRQAEIQPRGIALEYKKDKISYQRLSALALDFAGGCRAMNLPKGSRVGVFLPKQTETVSAFFGALLAGGCVVPVNPLLKAKQVQHILCDCEVSLLVTSQTRLDQLAPVINDCRQLKKIVLTDFNSPAAADLMPTPIEPWPAFCRPVDKSEMPRLIESDLAAIFYTSGSSGAPKGVVLTHHNMCAGAASVAQYQNNTQQDRILAVLPFSFDYGFNQLASAVVAGATVILLDYLLPKDVIRALEKTQATGLAGVPPLWTQITTLDWPAGIQSHLRYITNSGGTMPQPTLRRLQAQLPDTDIYLMYGLTEAFRSTCLPPDQVNTRPTSIGKAIPNAEIFVINANGEECQPDEVGELIHRGPLVAQGYWNDPITTARRYRPLPAALTDGRALEELVVWSGDYVKKDAQGYLYFVARSDEMIKTSGYRVSPAEVEEAILQLSVVSEAVAVGVPHPQLGQAIVAVVAGDAQNRHLKKDIVRLLKKQLPAYMMPRQIYIRNTLPCNANGKLDRRQLLIELENTFQSCPGQP